MQIKSEQRPYDAKAKWYQAKAEGKSNVDAYDVFYADIAAKYPENSMFWWCDECTSRVVKGENGGTMYGVVNHIMNEGK